MMLLIGVTHLACQVCFISASTIGSVVQWFDFYLYSIFSVTVFPAVFFPNLDVSTGITASFGVSFVGFVARPVGGAFFGWQRYICNPMYSLLSLLC